MVSHKNLIFWLVVLVHRKDPQHTEMDQYQMFGIGVLGNLVTTHNYYMNLAADKHFHRGLVEERECLVETSFSLPQ